MVNTPLPQSLAEECKKAAKILRSFSMDSVESGGVDKIIPPTLIMSAKGLAIMTVFKAGFLVSARAGSGLVVAKTHDGSWSAPSAIATAGIGGGFEVGAELTDFVFILNSQSAVDAFSRGGNVTLGGNLSVAVGPLGRNVEGDVALRDTAKIYTYSKTKGLFAGISLEGSGILERKEANAKMYGKDIRARELLLGGIAPPPEANILYTALREHCEGAIVKTAEYGMKRAGSFARDRAAASMPASVTQSYSQQRQHNVGKSKSGSGSSSSSSRFSRPSKPSSSAGRSSLSSSQPSQRSSNTATYGARSRSSSRSTSRSSLGGRSASTTSDGVGSEWNQELVVRAKFPYHSDEINDLSFRRGEDIVVVTRTETQEDWWEGRLRGKTGIFPANYVVLL